MDKIINIEWPYENIVLNLERMPKRPEKPLPASDWDLLIKAERRLYADDPGCHGYTDVNVNNGDAMLNSVWDNCQTHLEGTLESWDEMSVPVQARFTARRVALTFALMAFGPEFLLK